MHDNLSSPEGVDESKERNERVHMKAKRKDGKLNAHLFRVSSF